MGPVRTPYLEPLTDVPIEITPDPVVLEGWEAIVSSAYPSVPGLRRAEFLRELVGSRPGDRRRRHAWEGHHLGDDRVRPA